MLRHRWIHARLGRRQAKKLRAVRLRRLNYLIDVGPGAVIVDVAGRTRAARTYDEVAATKPMIERRLREDIRLKA